MTYKIKTDVFCFENFCPYIQDQGRNSYVSGVAWGLPSSFRNFKGKRSSSGPGSGTRFRFDSER